MTQSSPLYIDKVLQTFFNGRYHGTDVAVMTQRSPLYIGKVLQISFNGRYHGTDVAVMTQHSPLYIGTLAKYYKPLSMAGIKAQTWQ